MCIYIYVYIHMHVHLCICISPQLVLSCLCNSAAASLPWKLLRTYLESCANIVQAAVSARPPAPSSSRPHLLLARLNKRNTSKSTLAHDTVPAVLLHKHHLIIRVGAGLIQFVYCSHPRMTVDLPSTKIYFRTHFRGVFANWVASKWSQCLVGLENGLAVKWGRLHKNNHG